MLSPQTHTYGEGKLEHKFPSLTSFENVYRGKQIHPAQQPIPYGAKVKLHGCNTGVNVSKDLRVSPQTRSTVITVDADHYNFAKWVQENSVLWASAAHRHGKSVTVFGEWAGKGIQRNDAVTTLDDRYFFAFAVQVEDVISFNPEIISDFCPDLDHLLVMPWDHLSDPIDYASPENCTKFADNASRMLEVMGEEDPFISGIFGVVGAGEGWVYTPHDPENSDYDWMYPEFVGWNAFKVKTDAHAVKKQKNSVSKDIEVPVGAADFTQMFVTDARCIQGVEESCDGIAEPARTGTFLKWIKKDVIKESEHELLDSGLTWVDVEKHVTTQARSWFLKKCKEI